MASLSGRRVTHVRVLPPGHDLEITFEGALTLRVFSDREAAFIFFSPDCAFGVEEDGRLEVAT